LAERRRAIAETLAPGAPVARVAEACGVNGNHVFYWRSLCCRGRIVGEPAPTELMPVTVVGSGPLLGNLEANRLEGGLSNSDCSISLGSIHIDLPRAHLRIEGRADATALRLVLESQFE